MPSVHIAPHHKYAPDGLNRVLVALFSRLPHHGWDIAKSAKDADLVNYHVAAYEPYPAEVPFVHSNHGLHWADIHGERWRWPSDLLHANQRIIDLMCQAQAITAPSDWVSMAIRRGVLRRPETIYHGVDSSVWKPVKKPGKYVLWNKARVDIGCDPAHVVRLAGKTPDVEFVSTFGRELRNLKVLGRQAPEHMRETVAGAGLYLATTRETFGIGTLEALACGVPVVGWRWGGQAEIVIDGETGRLATPGNYDELADAVRWALANRPKLSEAARADAVARWGWEPRIAQYAALFDRVLAGAREVRPKVSVIVTCHNLGRYLRDCLGSVRQQSLADWECVIVDDDSADDSAEIAQLAVAEDARFVYYRTPSNLKLSGARNYGVARASGQYIIMLDADDMLPGIALRKLAGYLDTHPEIHIAYGGLDIISDDGTGRRRNEWPMAEFDWVGQMAHLNQMPYAAMMRREVLEESGGYRVRDWRAEDAALWCRVTSFGFRAARAVDEATLLYRIRPNSKSGIERAAGHDDGDWTAWYPWRVGAASGPEGTRMHREGRRGSVELTPFGAQGKAPGGCWPVWSHDNPTVSVVIPVGPKHADVVVDALDSVMAQTVNVWEAVVVNDAGGELTVPQPWARVIQCGKGCVAEARNAGIRAAKAPLIVFLDADDILLPDALERMLAAYVQAGGSRYIYTDWYQIAPDGTVTRKNSKEYDRSLRGLHPVTVLIEKAWLEAVGLFDPVVPAWEDWDIFVKLAINGYCGLRLAEPLLGYRIHAGQRREQSLNDAGEALPMFAERYADYAKGVKQMAGCCGGSSVAEAIVAAKRSRQEIETMVDMQGVPAPRPVNGLVRVQWTGNNKGAIQIRALGGKALSQTYRFGKGLWEFADCPSADAELLVSSGKCRYVAPPAIDVAATAVLPTATTRVASPTPAAVAAAAGFPQPARAATRAIFVEEEPAVSAEELPPMAAESAPAFDISAATVAQAREYAVTLGSAELRDLLAQEAAGKNRATLVALLERAIGDAERVG